MKQPISLKIENAKGKILHTINMAVCDYDLPAFIMDGILSSILADIRSEAKMEMVNDFNTAIQEEKEKEKEEGE